MLTPQLPLSLRFARGERFDTFFDPDGVLVESVRGWVEQGTGVCMLSGSPGSGKTHFALALCGEFAEAAGEVAYLPLRDGGAALIAGQAPSTLLVIDDVDVCLDDPGMQQDLFALHNRQVDAAGMIFYTSRSITTEWQGCLPDLRSRLEQSLRLRTPPLSDAHKRLWLERAASRRGFELDPAAIEYLLRRSERDLGSLGRLLDDIDRASLASQRRVTVPFLSAWLAARTRD